MPARRLSGQRRQKYSSSLAIAARALSGDNVARSGWLAQGRHGEIAILRSLRGVYRAYDPGNIPYWCLSAEYLARWLTS